MLNFDKKDAHVYPFDESPGAGIIMDVDLEQLIRESERLRVCKAIFNCKADVVCHLQMSFGFSAPIRGKASEIEMRMNRFNTECKISEGHYLSTALTVLFIKLLCS